jgi:hypothetical protein
MYKTAGLCGSGVESDAVLPRSLSSTDGCVAQVVAWGLWQQMMICGSPVQLTRPRLLQMQQRQQHKQRQRKVVMQQQWLQPS